MKLKRSIQGMPGVFLASLLLIGHVNAAPPDDALPISVIGELEILYLDDFDSDRAELQYFIKEKQSNRRLRLRFEGEPPGHLRAGSIIKIKGKAKGNDIYLPATVDGAEQPATETSASAGAPAVSGEQRTVVMVTDFQDTQLACSVDEIRDLMFTDPGNQSVDDYYQETSQGQVWLSGEVHGTYTIDNPDNCSAPFSAYTDPLDAAAEADGVDLSLFDRRIYVMPYTRCGYAGFGSVGNIPSQALIFTCGIPDVYAHELGHNFGMYHASTPNSEYGDGTGIMGAGNVGLRHLNSAHQDEMGWRSPAMNTLITGSGTYDIAPQSLDEAQSLAPQILRIAKPDTDEYYFIAYRRPIGFDSNLQWWHHDVVTVHRYQGVGGPPTNTYLLDELAIGENFTDAVNDITVSHISQTPDYATVQIAINGETTACSPGTPTISLAPASQSGEPGTTLSYSVSVTNQDSVDCAASSFALDNSVPNGWTGTVSPATLSLTPGQTDVATLLVASAAGANANTYGVSVTATDGSEAVHTATGDANYTVVNACAPAAPSMSVSPGSQNADAGATLVYTVSLTNNDSAACNASAFDLSIGSAPAGWNAGLSSQSLNLAPGSTGSASLSVTSAATAAPGSYNVQVAAADGQEATHARSAGTTYVVNEPATSPTEDTEAPTVPSGLAASANHKQVNLSWLDSSDNVGVAGYRVYRDDAQIAATAAPGYTDTTAADGVTYEYRVDAYDTAGNASPPSAPVTSGKAKAKGKGNGNGNGNGKGPNK